MFTRRESGIALPIELGAEFIHGRSPATLGWLAKSNTAIVDSAGERWTLCDGKPEPADNLFEQMKRGLQSIRRPRKDLPFSEFLDTVARRKLSPAARKLARALVEGFDAADATRVSTWATLDEWSGNSSADSPTFRPLGGYASLVDGLAVRARPRQVQVRLNTVVHTIQLATRPREDRSVAARAALQRASEARDHHVAASVCCSSPRMQRERSASCPIARKQQALAGLAPGPVIKVVLHFRKPFWEEIDDGRYRDGAVLPRARRAVPDVLVVGPAARLAAECLGWRARTRSVSPGATKRSWPARRSTVCSRCSAGRSEFAAMLERAYLHDWQADPFARGAYSYVIAGGTGARKALAAPVQNTLFFAGEAADTQGESGTVAGALQSGMSAARQVLDE